VEARHKTAGGNTFLRLNRFNSNLFYCQLTEKLNAYALLEQKTKQVKPISTFSTFLIVRKSKIFFYPRISI